MEALLLVGLIALAVVVGRQAQRIAALEATLRRFAARPPAAGDAAWPTAARVAAAAQEDRSEPPPPPPVRPAVPIAPAEAAGGAARPAPASAIFEQLVGGRLPIWVGGAALASAGYFLVRLAIESGLLTPAVRVLLASLSGFVLLALAEAAARLRQIADDARVNQALAGAGLATLYASAYLAGPHYGLIGPAASFAMMAAVTALALALSLRRGAPTALMGLVGGFATPLLAGAQGQAIAPLLVYLGLLSAGLFGLAVVRGWPWLALAGAAGSLLWSGLLIGTAAAGDALAAGGFALLLAIAATTATAATAGGGASAPLRIAPLAAAAAELAVLIATTGFAAGAWSLYLLLSAAAILLAWRDPRLAPAAAAVATLAAAALAGSAYAAPPATALGAAAGVALLFGGAGHALARRAADGRWWAGIGASGLLVPFALLRLARPTLAGEAGWAAAALLLALPPLHLAWRSRAAARAAPPFDLPLLTGAATAAAFLAAALAVALPDVVLPAAILAGGVALAESGRRIGDRGVPRIALAAAALAGLVMLARGGGLLAASAAALAGERLLLPLLPAPGDAVGGALVPAGLVALVAWRAGAADVGARRLLLTVAGIAAAAGLYVLWKRLFAIRDEAGFVAYGFLERALLTQMLFAAGWAARRVRGWEHAACALTAAAVARMLWLDLGVVNPAFVAQAVGPWPIANLATLHFAAAAIWIERAWRHQAAGRWRMPALAALVTVAAGGALLTVRQAFHGALLPAGPLGRAEFYGYSAAGVLLAAALFGRGAQLGDRSMRVAGLGLLTAMVLKVFLVDAAALEGLLRIASFVGLGVTLIAIGWAYGRFPAAAPAVRT